MNPSLLKAPLLNSYLAHKQHLLPTSQFADVVQTTRDIVALHATNAAGPYLSLWARVPGFQRQMLDDVLYERRELVRALCMRATLHVVPSDEAPYFFRAYAEGPAELRDLATLLVQAGICQQEGAEPRLTNLQLKVLDVLSQKGPSTAREISQVVPELMTKVRHSVGKPYEGEFSIGSRVIPSMCAQGLLIRARPRGTWRSNLYEYAPLAAWLPAVDLEAVTPQEAKAWVVRRYLSAFGPATFDDVQWWTGFSKSETKKAIKALEPTVIETTIEGLGDGYLMLVGDAEQVHDSAPPEAPYVFLLPGLDPYIMGYRNRRRFLAPEHHAKVFDRAGNAMPTVWVNGRVIGAWGQRKDGSVTCGTFEPVGEEEQALLADEVRRLEAVFGGEYLPSRSNTPFTRALR